MNKITAAHLARTALVYVRQSTSDQLLNNPERRRRQYGLVDRARALGGSGVEVIDDNLGRSGSGIARPLFREAPRRDLPEARRPRRLDRGLEAGTLAYPDRVLRAGPAG
jgi:hypothetical protein